MLSEKDIKSILDQALAASTADQTEVLLYATDSALTRFANNAIHQNVAERDVSLTLRVVLGKRIGVASINSIQHPAIRSVVERALEAARLQPENPDFRSLPQPAHIKAMPAFCQATADYTPRQRAEAVGTICRRSQEAGLVASGALETSTTQMAVANSLGLLAYHQGTLAEANTVIMSETSAGYADCLALDINGIDFEAMAQEAVGKALQSQNPIPLEPGGYEVILEEYAVSDILDALAHLGLSALAVQEGRSFMRFGERVVGRNITLWDDGLDASTIPMPFDFEGVPKQRVEFIREGVAKAVCYDSYTAGKEGKRSTGHALPPGETYGPQPMNMFLKPGTASKEEMLAAIQHGLWVTRFHYTRPVHPLPVIVTGMTRDGTFLIEHGEITQPVKNLRFTQGYLKALSNVTMLGRDTKLERTAFSFNRVPALKIAGFNFTGATQF